MMRWPKQKVPGPIAPEGRRLIGFTLEGDHPIFAPPGHSTLLSANGGGKTCGVTIKMRNPVQPGPVRSGIVKGFGNRRLKWL